MLINRDVLIGAVLKFKNDFFKFIDYINSQGGALEFPEAYYVRFYNQKVLSQDDASLKTILSLQSLLDGGIFTHRDKLKGSLVLSKVVYDLLIFLDVSRNKELSLAKFESLRTQMLDITTNIVSSEIGSDTYQEHLQLFWELISQILTTIKENIRVLHHKVDEVAEQYQLLDSGERKHNVNELYQLAQKLHERYVQPCLEFINPDLQLVNSLNFVQAVDYLIHYYRDDGNEALAIAIQYKLTAITSYYKDIRELSERLLAYLYSLSEERRYFMAIEQRFNELMETFVAFRHGGRKNLYLTPELEDIAEMRCFDGLSAHKQSFSVRFNRHPDKSMLQFKNYYEQIWRQPLKPKVDISQAPEAPDNKQKQRKNRIMQLTTCLPTGESIEDIHELIDSHLRATLPDFTLLDTLYGLEFYLPLLNKNNITQSRQRARLEDETYYLEYLRLQYHQTASAKGKHHG
ncbi:hypothetical protein [Psychrobacter pygoscelis]|uniref:hypothetical protein n=1 Tax=Psychrobacter pygoscelis TaxID=2488563 RepID=UPI00103F8557|nr:hypothetical protein [Psychrobacter pygoscelis]